MSGATFSCYCYFDVTKVSDIHGVVVEFGNSFKRYHVLPIVGCSSTPEAAGVIPTALCIEV